MARSTTMRLRGLWLQVHKWIGLLLAVLIIPISLTGSALVWHDWLDETVNPQRYAVTGGEPALPPVGLCRRGAAARSRRASGSLSLRYPEHGEGPIARPPPPRAAAGRRAGRRGPTSGSIRPTAAVLDKASSNAGLVRVIHVLHGSLMMPGLGPARSSAGSASSCSSPA